MKKEIPQGVVYGVIALVVVGVVVAAAIFFGAAGGGMSNEEAKRAEMQAQAGNERLRGYIGNAQGGPPAGGEAEARQKHSGGQ